MSQMQWIGVYDKINNFITQEANRPMSYHNHEKKLTQIITKKILGIWQDSNKVSTNFGI